jgi:hypothetical protein
MAEIKIQLNNTKELFVAPELDPFCSDALRATGQSAMEYIRHELTASGLRERMCLVLQLPADQITPAVPQAVHNAIRRYCQEKQRENRQELRALRWRGVKALQTGFVVLAVCLLLAALFGSDKTAALPAFLRTFLSEGFTIAGWVSLWTPLEILLYEWWPVWRGNQIYQHLEQMEVVVVSRLSPTPIA